MAWWTTRFNELSAAAAPQPIPVEDSDSLYVDDYNFLYYILEPGTRWIDEDETMKVVEDLVELSAAAAPQPIPVEDSDSLYVDDYNFQYYILEPGTRWIDEDETMKVVEDLVELSAAPQPILVEDSDSLYVDDYNFLYYILEPGTRWIDEEETMKVVEDLVELSAAAAPQPIPVEDSDSLYVDDYNFQYYILEPGTRWVDEDETMKVVEDLVELSAAAAPQPIMVEDSDSLYVDDYNFLYYILEPGTRWIDEEETMKVVEDLVELSAAAAPQPFMVEDSDSLYVDDYSFLYYILEPGTRWIDEEETMKVVENLVELLAAAAPQPVPVEDSDSLYVEDYNFLYYILEPGTRWIDEEETMKVVEYLVELSAAAAPQPIPVEDSDSLYVEDYNFLYYILEPGTRWIDEDETMKVVEDLVDQDNEVPEDVRSMEEIVKMANLICPIL